MNSILARIQAAQQSNPVLQKAADGGPITDDSKKTASVATDMVEGATNIPDVTKDVNTSPVADIGKAGEEVVNDEITPAAPVSDNDSNPDVQDILNTAETVIKTANAILPVAQAFSQMSDTDISMLFDKQASAGDMTNEQMFSMIQKMASNGSTLAEYFMDFCAGCDAVMQKVANDTEALIAQGVDPEEAEAMATQALAGDMGMTGEVSNEEAGAELEAAVAEITAEVAGEIMAESPETSPEEAQAMAEELVISQLEAELAEGATESAPMEQTASAEDVVDEEAGDIDVTADVEAGAEDELEGALEEIVIEVAQELLQENPEADPAEALEVAVELVTDQLASELSKGVDGGEGAKDMMEQTASAEDVPNEAVNEAEAAIDELIMATAEEIKAAAPEVSDEEAIQFAEEAVMDAAATAQEQEAIGATTEDGEYAVPDDVVAASVDDMAKTAAANPLRDILTPVVAELLGIDQNAFINRITK